MYTCTYKYANNDRFLVVSIHLESLIIKGEVKGRICVRDDFTGQKWIVNVHLFYESPRRYVHGKNR